LQFMTRPHLDDWSQGVTVWVDCKAFWLFLPAVTGVFVRGESSESFEAPGKVVSHQKGLQVFF